MSTGLGKVQRRCLTVIANYEREGELATTYNIATYVYQVQPDEDGELYFTTAQHVAVKRALEGLQRQGKVIGLAQRFCRAEYDDTWIDHRSNYLHCWMTEKQARQWIRERSAGLRPELVETFKAKMLAIGMQPPK
jgi:hypothetical protein